MTAEETAQTGADEATTSDNTQGEELPTTTEPTLNRAQRRAQAKNKQGAAGTFNSNSMHNQNKQGFGGRNGGGGGKTNIPRTGHK